jgi:hypothetical protein
MAIKVDWSPVDDDLSHLHQLEKLELWSESETLRRRRKLLSVRLGASERRENDGAAFNFSRGGSSAARNFFQKHLVLEEGDFRLYQIPERRPSCPAVDEEGDVTSVTSSVVLGTWMDRSSGGGLETVAFCMLNVHLQHVVEVSFLFPDCGFFDETDY